MISHDFKRSSFDVVSTSNNAMMSHFYICFLYVDDMLITAKSKEG